MTPIPAVVPPLPRAQTWKRNIAPATALDWLAAGWRDFTIYPGASISYGLLVFLVSVVTTVGLFALRLDYILLPAFAGFMVVGPIIGIGLYEKSRRIAEGRSVSLWQMVYVRPESGGQVLFAGVLLFLLTLLWMRAAVILYALFFGLRPFPGLDHIIPMLFTTDDRLGDAGVGQRRRRPVCGVCIRDQRLLHPDAAVGAHGCIDRHGHQHGPGLEQSARHVDLGGNHAGVDRGRHRHRTAGHDRDFPGAGTRKLARVPDDAASSSTRGIWSCLRWVVAVRSGIDSAAAGCARSRRGSAAREPHRRRRRAPNRSVRAHDPLRRMHSDDREGARRACRRGKRPRQSLDQARNRQVASRWRSAAADRNARSRPASRRICSISSPTARMAH